MSNMKFARFYWRGPPSPRAIATACNLLALFEEIPRLFASVEIAFFLDLPTPFFLVNSFMFAEITFLLLPFCNGIV